MELLKRYILLLIGLTIMAFATAFSIVANLGTSPITSLPYVAGLMSGLTVGVATIIMHMFFIILQIIILRKQYKWIQLLQLPVALFFGVMIDGAMWCLSAIPITNYFMQWVYCIISILLMGIGVAIEVKANVIVLAGEGIVLAICQVTHWQFPRTKIAFDSLLVIISIILSLCFLHGLHGVREGTIAAALLVGIVAKYARVPIDKITSLK